MFWTLQIKMCCSFQNLKSKEVFTDLITWWSQFYYIMKFEENAIVLPKNTKTVVHLTIYLIKLNQKLCKCVLSVNITYVIIYISQNNVTVWEYSIIFTKVGIKIFWNHVVPHNNSCCSYDSRNIWLQDIFFQM